MTTTPGNASSNLPGKPPVVDLATWQAAREELLVREKVHTREGDAIAAARRRLPMVELDGAVEVTGVDGTVPFLDLFQGRDELVVYKHMWYDGAPYQGQCEGCTTTAWHMKDAVYLNARGVSFAVLTSGPWDEVAPYVEFMGYTQPWYSVRGVEAPVGGEMGHIVCFLRDGDRVFLTYSTTGRGNEPVNGSPGLLDMTPYGRGEAYPGDHLYLSGSRFGELLKPGAASGIAQASRSEEHTSELQSLRHLVCRLLHEKKNHRDLKELLLLPTRLAAGQVRLRGVFAVGAGDESVRRGAYLPQL